MYDIIGDIHGYADQLEMLLDKLGYENTSGYYKHSERKVIFVGDFIDRGPKIKETLSIVKNMIDNKSAYAVMGNHEFNALCYFTENSEGGFVRPHSEKNNFQMKETLQQFEGMNDEWNYYLDWFRTLPVFIETENIRIVHACWEDVNIQTILKNEIDFSENFLSLLFKNKNSDLYKALDISLKGKEEKIPGGFYFTDKENVMRYTNRVKWWLDPLQCKYSEYYFEFVKELNDTPVDVNKIKSDTFYNTEDKPVFCGHYWLNESIPKIQTKNVVCVDHSIAKDGILSAYRYSGEKELNNDNFVWV